MTLISAKYTSSPQAQCIPSLTHSVFFIFCIASWVIVDVMEVLWPNNTLFLPLAVAPLCVAAFWKGLCRNVAFNWVNVTLGEKESGWKSERKYEAKFEKPFLKGFHSRFIRRGLVWTTLFIYPIFVSHISTSLPYLKTAVATMCCMFTSLCLSTIVMFLQHQPIKWVWGLDLEGGRICFCRTKTEACSRKGYGSDQKDSQQTAAPPIHTAKICWL